MKLEGFLRILDVKGIKIPLRQQYLLVFPRFLMQAAGMRLDLLLHVVHELKQTLTARLIIHPEFVLHEEKMSVTF